MPGIPRIVTSPSQEEFSVSSRLRRRPSKDITQIPLDQSMPFSVIIFGATGDLARKKIFPALYQLILLGHFPRTLNIIGYGRSKVNLSEFTAKQCVNVKEQSALSKAEFMARISFHAGPYDSPESFKALAMTFIIFWRELSRSPDTHAASCEAV